MSVPCPDEIVLRGLLDSSLPEPVQAEVTSHLDDCRACQEKLEQIATDGSPVLEVARATAASSAPQDSSAFWPSLREVEDAIHSVDPGQTRTRLDNKLKPGNAFEADFGFLDPVADGEEGLGRLGNYQVHELVGRGGMGMVFRAVDPCLGRVVAIKLLDPQYARNELARERFLREARSAAGVTHENVVTIHQVDCNPARSLTFIVMQFVRGKSLQELLDRSGSLPVHEAVRIAAATAAGLAAAHRNHLIHRDVKPGNILIEEPSGRVLLTDFGLARLIDEDLKLTQSGMVAGTPLYMSPEQARGEPVDHRGDLFSLGSVLYAMLAGVPPFQGNSPLTVLKHVTERQPRPVQDANPAVPDSLAAIVQRLMAKDASKRYTDAGEAAAALFAELSSLPTEESPRASRGRFRRGILGSWSFRILVAATALLAPIGLSELFHLTEWTVLGQRGRVSAAPVAEVHGPAAASAPVETPTHYTLPPADGPVWAVAFDPCGELLATATEGGTVKLWDARDGHARGILTGENYRFPIWSIAFSRDGSQLATAHEDGYVRLWDTKTKQETGIAFKHPFPVHSVAISTDGKRVAGGTSNGAVIIWDLETGRKLHSTTGHEGGAVSSLAFSPDSLLLVSGGTDRTVRVWDVEEGTAHSKLSGHTGPVYSVSFDPKGETIASAGWDHTLRLWDANTSDQLKAFDVAKEDIWSLAFAPTGEHVLIGNQDGVARWVNIDTGAVDREFRANGSPAHAVAMSKDGGLIAVGSRDGTVRVWDLDR